MTVFLSVVAARKVKVFFLALSACCLRRGETSHTQCTDFWPFGPILNFGKMSETSKFCPSKFCAKINSVRFVPSRGAILFLDRKKLDSDKISFADWLRGWVGETFLSHFSILSRNQVFMEWYFLDSSEWSDKFWRHNLEIYVKIEVQNRNSEL